MQTHSRELAWDGCLNVRDLGGHQTEDGGETRYRAVVRADSVRQLSEGGWEAAVAYGVSTVVDLRSDDELEADPPAELPVTVLHLPVFDDDPDAFAEIERVSSEAPDYQTATRDVYLVFLERFGHNIARAVEAVARAPEGTVLIHCAGGKDRTGVLTALLLRVAGVDDEQIGADYAVSEERLRPRHEKWLEEAATEAERERIRRISATPAAAMTAVLEELERRHGSIHAYLRESGVSDDDLARVRARLRG